MSQLRIAYLFTTFPVESETFLQREVRGMRELPVSIEIYSLHRGQNQFEGIPVECFPKWKLLSLIWWFPYWLWRKPEPVLKIIALLLCRRPPCGINFLENLLGFAFALVKGAHFRANMPDLFHAVWATAPASAAMLLREFTDAPFSMGAHAYDVFRHGGDWFLAEKLKTARMIHTTTEAAREVLLKKCEGIADKLILIRRGLNIFPHYKKLRADRRPIRLLSVGRLVEKKGFFQQLAIYHHLNNAGFSFEARIAGWGPLERPLYARLQKLDLRHEVLLLGKLDYTGVLEQYEWADAFIFTGKVAGDGDRDGLPNVIAEAMAAGLPVLSTDVGGSAEAIQDGKTGILLKLDEPDKWHVALERLQKDDDLAEQLRSNARDWVIKEFDARKNAAKLSDKLHLSAGRHPESRNPHL